MGAFFAAIVGNAIGLPFPIALAISIFAGALGGAAWGFIPGALKAWRGAHEVVTTIMLNSIAYLLLNLLASSIFKDPTATFPRTPDISPGAVLPIILADTRLHGGIVLALLTAFAVWFVLFKTTLGFEIRTVGANASAARYAGIRPSFIIVLTMSISGGLAGMGGSVEILGNTKNYPAEYLVNFGIRWDRRGAPRSGASVGRRRCGPALRDHACGCGFHAACDRDPGRHHQHHPGRDPAVRGRPGRHRAAAPGRSVASPR